MQKQLIFYCWLWGLLITSCSVTKLNVSSVNYQSLRNSKGDIQEKVPEDAKILVVHSIDSAGVLSVFVRNLTDSIMLIDRTKSFFINTDGTSTAYYDPTVTTTTNTVSKEIGTGVGVNLGAVGSALGASGTIGQVLNGINVGSSSSTGAATSNTTYTIDQPSVSIGPRGQAGMGRNFIISAVGNNFFKNLGIKQDVCLMNNEPKNSNIKFSICVTYSLDGGKTFDRIISDYYVNSLISLPINSKGKVNDVLRNVLSIKQDALNEKWFILYFNTNIPSFNTYYNNKLYDYK